MLLEKGNKSGQYLVPPTMIVYLKQENSKKRYKDNARKSGFHFNSSDRLMDR